MTTAPRYETAKQALHDAVDAVEREIFELRRDNKARVKGEDSSLPTFSDLGELWSLNDTVKIVAEELHARGVDLSEELQALDMRRLGD
jgi:hypothetical protein